MGLRVDLKDLDETTEGASYAFELRAVKDHGFKVVQEQCVVVRKDRSKEWFDRCEQEFESSRRSLDPAPMEDALVLPLVGGHRRFRAVHQYLAEMAVYRIDPAVLRDMQDPDDGARLRPDGKDAASVLREIWSRGEDDGERLCEILASIVPHTVGVNSKRRGNKLALEFVQDWGRSKLVKLEAFGMSDGTLRALRLLVAVFQRSVPSVLVIEEPYSRDRSACRKRTSSACISQRLRPVASRHTRSNPKQTIREPRTEATRGTISISRRDGPSWRMEVGSPTFQAVPGARPRNPADLRSVRSRRPAGGRFRSRESLPARTQSARPATHRHGPAQGPRGTPEVARRAWRLIAPRGSRFFSRDRIPCRSTAALSKMRAVVRSVPSYHRSWHPEHGIAGVRAAPAQTSTIISKPP